MQNNLYYMQQALEESKKAQVISSPNPAVGAVIVRNNKIVGRGFTQSFGKEHAEVMAIRNCRQNPAGAALFVTLEPCSYHGKTPPCTDLIISKGIKEVYVGLKDPNPLVNGAGIKKLQQAGIKVITGLAGKAIEEQLQWYIKYCKNNIPYVILKTGMSLDSKITDRKGKSRWITSDKARQASQQLREINDGVIVGINTIIKDDPCLSYRGGKKKRFNRIILDTHLRIPLKSKVLKTVKNHKTLIATSLKTSLRKIKKLIDLKDVEILFIRVDNDRIVLEDLLMELGKRGIAKIIVEGGGLVNYSFLKQDLVDRLCFFIAPRIIGGDFSKSLIGSEGFLLPDARNVKRGQFQDFKDYFVFKGYMHYYKA
ncbi:MAG: bifunctional diaminohydroxyphosphoribosylaminopyrimidine deaminase/5-amino-6-(5-phosphoribosylamino)uracil reductase RibD [Spirochaetes bacterium]|nr:bifunctional diaminohydroxyphosphoribosylaminopyrimidine deaminase/5-amino-6-(5-phosphoribosylamino)uracil reductase RibD [Spirochaetota bacterium]